MLGGGIPCLDHPIEVLADDGIIRRFDDRYQLQRVSLGGMPCLLRLQAGNAKAKLTRKRKGDVDLRGRKPVRRVVVCHELADQLAILLDRNEGDRADTLASNRLLEGV